MAAETEQLKARSLSELSNLRMKKEENIDAYVNRAEALRNQCVQLGKNIEDYELRMYIIRGLRTEFDQNVRVLETQSDITINNIRYALKQEELRRSVKKEEKTSKEEYVRRAKEKTKNDVTCYNCGMKGHISSECRNKQKCFNCQGFNHIAAECKQPKKDSEKIREAEEKDEDVEEMRSH
ncbi:rna-dependent dna polymerase [Lasius niger]|uniref:Rna-dependent dna polymerase n=1 Tax=Lasius niger TaxID=67767 RepID=A0A0J7K5T1_LASNI|nr:rna-dependent dna polymerase [Lasius niger]